MPPNENLPKERSPATEQQAEGKEDERQLIGYKGEWYDITNFIKFHPGGDIIKRFIGTDATYEIEINHPPGVMGKRVPAKTNKPFIERKDAFSEEMYQLHLKMRREGFYCNSLMWYFMKCVVTLSILIPIVYIIMKRGDSYWYNTLAGCIMALFWQQCGLLMHDFLHTEVTGSRKTDGIFGRFFCTVCFGVGSTWWKEGHHVHHVMTNVADSTTEFVDPQAFQDAWAQNSKLFHFIKPHMRWLIKIQFYSFLPLLLVIGRLRLLNHSYKVERTRGGALAILLHWILMFSLLAQFPSWKNALLFYSVASSGEGFLHLQLLLNHYSKPFYDESERTKHDHFRAMILSNVNLVNPIWTDWLHAGLNFHHEHHCFPRLSRNKYRTISPMIKDICKRHGVQYDETTTWSSFKRTMKSLHDASQLYKLLEME